MNLIIIFLVGLIVGAVLGSLVYRNNAKKFEAEAKKLKEELDKIKLKVKR